ncbi:MAG: capsular biosynthesis protein CpsI [Geobacteraceae bacterium GWC2_53_11]|nr:MAG: capsular biosynthesis protein CpsI [Geobacteraceae bacterium GWC2_53_11]
MSGILVTGAAGFIGFHLVRRLLLDGHTVTGFDNLNDYYDVALKGDRLVLIDDMAGFTFVRGALEDRSVVERLFQDGQFDYVINLAAQAGVRYSLQNPYSYIDSNISGFLNVLEGCRQTNVRHLVYASSSSVYGANVTVPFSEHHPVDHPVSLYAATKRSNELMAHTYAHLFNIPVTGLRFFTVYGPWGRPDMAYFSFTKAILEGRTIDVFNHGRMQRDFTYIDDIIEGIVRVIDHVPVPDPSWNAELPDVATSSAPYRVFNIGNHQPVELGRFIEVLEECLGKKAEKRFLPMQPGEVLVTCADVTDLNDAVGFRPDTGIEAGLSRFVSWYREYYGIV